MLTAGEPLVYAYYEGIDKIAHLRGFGPYYDAELMAVDRMVGDLLEVLPEGGGAGGDRRPRPGRGGSSGHPARPGAGGRGAHAERRGPVSLVARPTR